MFLMAEKAGLDIGLDNADKREIIVNFKNY